MEAGGNSIRVVPRGPEFLLAETDRNMPARAQMQRMVASGTATFDNPADYQAAIDGASIKLTLTGGGDFTARLTWLNLRYLRVVRGREKLPRIAYISLPADRVIFSFPTNTTPATWSGLELRYGDILFRGCGQRTHHWTAGESQWGLISLPPEQFAAVGKALTGSKITLPPDGRMLRPSGGGARLLRLHSRVCRLAETRHELIEKPEIARALEQELLHALVNCLTEDDSNGDLGTRRHHADIMVRFEDALSAHVGPQLNMPELCATLGVPERTLRVCCNEFLGMSPSRYYLWKRLNTVRSALQHADPATASVAAIARSCEFFELGRFAATYRIAFGELPSTTLRRFIQEST
jgi:AraC-like DNA-binding protein